MAATTRKAGLLRVTASMLLAGAASAATAQSGDELAVYAAGSLRAALTEVGKAFAARHPGLAPKFTFGASGLLKDRLFAGERAQVFTSANMEHPQAVHAAGKGGPVQRFARNSLCALARPGLPLTPDTLVQRLLDPAVRVGTSTPKADPSGDYAWQMFERIEASGVAGAFKTLDAKALQLTGGPTSPPPPKDRNVYGKLVEEGAADVFITYCTNAVQARGEVPALQVVDVPAAINVGASYGVTLLEPPSASGRAFIEFLLSSAGQAVLARHGFSPG